MNDFPNMGPDEIVRIANSAEGKTVVYVDHAHPGGRLATSLGNKYLAPLVSFKVEDVDRSTIHSLPPESVKYIEPRE